MQLRERQFYKLVRSVLVGHYLTDPYGACPRHHEFPSGTILYLEEINFFRRPCGNGRYARFTLTYNEQTISYYVRISKRGYADGSYIAAHPLELLADAAE